MIDVIGKQRVGLIALLLLVGGALTAGQYLYVLPEQESLERTLRSTRAQTNQKRAEIERLSREYQQIQEQKSYFQNLQDAGFFSQQSRAVASRRIEDVQEFSRVLSARYTIEPAQIKKFEDADEAGYVILSSPIKIKLDALDDIDIYNFIFWLENTLPGQTAVESVELTKKASITEARLRGIGSGNPVVMVSGDVVMNWQTIVPAEQVENAAQGGQP